MSERRLTSFSDVPYWKETAAEGCVVKDILGVELRIDEFTTAPGKSEDEEYENLFVLALNLETEIPIKFRCGSKVMLDQLKEVPADEFPVLAAIYEEGSGNRKYYTFK